MTNFKARLHSGQMQVHKHPARFKVLACGRRWGKTRLGVNECIGVAAAGGRAWWVSPSYKMSEVGWRPLRQIAATIPGADIRKVDRRVTLPGGGSVQVRSADKPDSLRGEGLDFVVMDECAFIAEAAWTEALRPALSDRLGSAMFISTPKGRNWFWRAYQRGLDGEQGEWAGWRFPTSSNPFIDQGEIEAVRAGTPERIFAQEYLAEFLEDAGGVFRGVMAAATATEQAGAIDGHDYIIGADWAQMVDFTVFVVIDTTTRQVVHMDRFNQIDYSLQVDRLSALARRFRPVSIIAEQNSIGMPVITALQQRGLPVQPFQTTNASKHEAIKALTMAFESGDIQIIPDDVLIGELQAFEAERLPSGLLRYAAPEGMHDDCVMALAIGWQGVANYRPAFL